MSRIIQQGGMQEIHVKKHMKQLFDVVKFIHINNIVHRDIKPDNFLFETKDENSNIKLVDFGLSYKTDQEATSGFQGSP